MIEKFKSIILYFLSLLKSKKSYAQHLEDLTCIELFNQIEKFIDIGANDGYSVSNTFLFALQGAKGLSFEPVQKIYNRLSAFYWFNSKVKTFKLGLSNKKDTIQIREDGLLSSILDTEDESCKVLLKKYSKENASIAEIQVDTLDNILQKYSEFYDNDVVSLDVEGHEFTVLEGINFQKFQTKCFIIETHGENSETSWQHQDYDKIDTLLQENNYEAVLKNQNNTFWIHKIYLDPKKVNQIIKQFPGYSKA